MLTPEQVREHAEGRAPVRPPCDRPFAAGAVRHLVESEPGLGVCAAVVLRGGDGLRPAVERALPGVRVMEVIDGVGCLRARGYDEVQREIDEVESELGFGGEPGRLCGEPVELLSSARLRAPASEVPERLRLLYEERDRIGGCELKEAIGELKRRLAGVGIGEGEASLVLLAYSLDGRRTDALGQYMAATHAPSLAREDWGRQVESIMGAVPTLGRVKAMRAVEVLSSYEFAGLFGAGG